MVWPEFCTLVGGLMPDTPLGQIVGIRAETDGETIKNFTSDQRKIYNTWQNKMASVRLEDESKLDDDMKNLSKMLNGMFGKGGKVNG